MKTEIFRKPSRSERGECEGFKTLVRPTRNQTCLVDFLRGLLLNNLNDIEKKKESNKSSFLSLSNAAQLLEINENPPNSWLPNASSLVSLDQSQLLFMLTHTFHDENSPRKFLT